MMPRRNKTSATPMMLYIKFGLLRFKEDLPTTAIMILFSFPGYNFKPGIDRQM
jgi:hypothetical protein